MSRFGMGASSVQSATKPVPWENPRSWRRNLHRATTGLVLLLVLTTGCSSETLHKSMTQSSQEPQASATTEPVDEGEFPTVETTGPRAEPTKSTGPTQTARAGETIERATINGRLTIKHDDVTVRDVIVRGTGTYMIYIIRKDNGECPRHVRLEYVEVDGSQAPADSIPIYSPECGFTIDHGLLHNLGRAIRVVNDVTIENTYIYLNRTWEGAHRSGVSTHGGKNIVVKNNVILCEKGGCTAAITMYGDHAPVDGYLLEHNVIATTGSYCIYGGNLDGSNYPEGRDIKIVDNHFSTRYFPECGKYGPVTGFDAGVRGNEWHGNVWQESGKPVSEGA